MDLYILRHGLAGEHGDPKYSDDSQRPLTSKGREKLGRAVNAMKKLDLGIDLILTSPFARASQTAEIVAEGYSKAKVEHSDHLTPDGKVKNLIKQLEKFDGDSRIMLVGHEPYLSELISVLISGDSNGCIKLKKGGLCKLGIEKLKHGQCATLQWLLTPAQLEEIEPN